MLVTILVVLLILGLALYGTRYLPIDGGLLGLIQFALVAIAIIYLIGAVL